MKQDDNLQQLFDDFRPTLTDSDQFMQSLSHKLDAIDYLTQRQLLQQRQLRRTACITLVAGILIGSILTGAYLLFVQPSPMFTLSLQADLWHIIHDNLPVIGIALTILFIAIATIIITNLLMDTVSYSTDKMSAKRIRESKG